jgi:hypothetical protein
MKDLNWKKAILAGIIGTLLFDIVGLLFTGQWWDIPGLLGQKTGLGFIYGIFGHYGNGIMLAILYTAIAPHLWGPYWVRPLIFVTGETIALVWLFMLPLLGAGVAGINQSAMTPVVTLLRHFAFALPLIFWVNQEFAVPAQQQEATAQPA